jgi:hypothetical protein
MGKQRGWLWMFWTVCVAQAILGTFDPTDQILQIARTFLFAGQCFLAFVAIAGGVVADPVQSSAAFWLTRPISRRQLLHAKLLFVFGLVVVPLLAGLGVGIANAGFTGGQLVSSIFQWGLFICTAAAALGAVGTHAGTTAHLVAFGGGAFALFFASAALLRYVLSYFPSIWRSSFAPDADISGLLVGLPIAFVGMMIAWYLRSQARNQRRSLPVGAVTLIVLMVIVTVRPFSFLRENLTQLPGDAIEVITEEKIRIDETPPGEQVIWSHFRVKDLPANTIALPTYFGATFKTPAHFVLNSSHHEGRLRENGIERLVRSPAQAEFLRLVRRQFPEDTVWSARRFSNHPNGLPVSNGPKKWPKDRTGEFRGTLKLDLMAVKRLADVPLTPGFRRLGRGFGINIREIVETEQGTRVVVDEVIPNLMFTRQSSYRGGRYWKASCLYVLFHPESREAFVLDEHNQLRNTPSFLNNQSVTTLKFNVPRSALRERLTGNADDDWVRSLRLHAYHTEGIGRMARTFAESDYKFVSSRAAQVSQYQASSRSGMDRLRSLKWPGTADPVAARKFASDFLHHAPDSFYGKDSSQTLKLLNDIGPNLVPFLLGAGTLPDSLKRVVLRNYLRKNLRPEHQPAVLSALAHDPDLAWILRTKNWVKEGLPILAKLLKARDRLLESDALVLLSAVATADQYDDLSWHAIRCGSGQEYVFRNLRKLEGFPYAETVQAAWKRARLDMVSDYSLAVFAAEQGELDGLHILVRQLRDSPNPSRDRRYLEVLKDRLDATGDTTVLKNWLLTNAPNLRFDAGKQKYVL